MDLLGDNAVVVAVISLVGTVAVGFFSYKAGIAKVDSDGILAKRDDKRDDFDVITTKYAEIIDRLEIQVEKQQMQIQVQDDQITKLIRERNTLKRQVELMIQEVRQLKNALIDFPHIDEAFVKHIEEIHSKIVDNGDGNYEQ